MDRNINSLPTHGRAECNQCFAMDFDKTKRTEGDWRITANPLAWGSEEPEVLVLRISEGPTQAGALANAPHDEIGFKGGRTNVGKILRRIGLLQVKDDDGLAVAVDRLIADRRGHFRFGSSVRCTSRSARAVGRHSYPRMKDARFTRVLPTNSLAPSAARCVVTS